MTQSKKRKKRSTATKKEGRVSTKLVEARMQKRAGRMAKGEIKVRRARKNRAQKQV